jgi:pilus assembly protein CpaF
MSRKAVFEASLAYFLEPIARLLEDEAVTEIMMNGHDRIFVERKGRLEQVNARFDDEDALVSAATGSRTTDWRRWRFCATT